MLPAHWHCSQISTVSSIKHNRKVNASGYIEDFAVAVFSSLWAQSLSFFGHIAQMNYNAEARSSYWNIRTGRMEENGRRRITGMRTVLDNFESHYVTLTEGVNVA